MNLHQRLIEDVDWSEFNNKFHDHRHHVQLKDFIKEMMLQTLSRQRSELRERVSAMEQTKPMDIVDESLADIAADTKGEAWMLGYNAALDDLNEKLV